MIYGTYIQYFIFTYLIYKLIGKYIQTFTFPFTILGFLNWNTTHIIL